jgi:phosphoglycerate kinase
MDMMALEDLDLKQKKVLVRVDFNVPLDKSGKITDSTRIKESLPTIQYILKNKGSVILMSHLGRPKGKKNPEFSLAPCVPVLSEFLRVPVKFVKDCIGPEVDQAVSELKTGEVLLLDNLRFYAAEEEPEKDPSFAKKLASYGDVYVNDAFGTAHRKHSSTAVIAEYFPSKAAAGLLMQKEVTALRSLLSNPSQPFYVLIGGAKVSSKMGVLTSLLDKARSFFIGGGMAYTFLKAQGYEVGDSILEMDLIETAKEFLSKCQRKNINIFLPVDLWVAKEFSNESDKRKIEVAQGVPQGWQGMDIGPQTLYNWEAELKKASTIFWNGPVGVFEFENFSNGTFSLARFLSSLPSKRIVGGGDSVAAISQLGLSQQFTHVSTGGGASLEFIEYGHLPGIDALAKK